MNKTMYQPLKINGVLERALFALEAGTGLQAKIFLHESAPDRDDPNPLVDVDVFAGDRAIRFAVEVKNVDRFQTLQAIKAKARPASHPILLVAPYVSEATAQQCRALRLPFIDEAGNAYLEVPGLYVYVTGKRRIAQAKPARKLFLISQQRNLSKGIFRKRKGNLLKPGLSLERYNYKVIGID